MRRTRAHDRRHCVVAVVGQGELEAATGAVIGVGAAMAPAACTIWPRHVSCAVPTMS